MSIRYPAGFIRIGYDPLKVPDAPTIGTATAGDTQASVAFTAPSNVGGSAISSYTAVSTPSGISASGASSPITVTGLTNGTAYTFAVWALNTYGPSAYSAASGSVTPDVLQRALFNGGSTGPTRQSAISYITITTTGNATNFGNLTAAKEGPVCCASTTRGIIAGGNGDTGNIDYVTLASTGNAVNFGTVSYVATAGGFNSSTRGVLPQGGGANGIFYVTIATTGNAVTFGQLGPYPYNGVNTPAGFSSPTRGIVAGGNDAGGTRVNIINYVTIATTGNSTDFGDLGTPTNYTTGCSSSTRGLIAGGATASATSGTAAIDYITIATTGNSTGFGSLIISGTFIGAAAGLTRAVFAGGATSSGNVNVIQYVTIASTGSATDFGDLSAGLYLANGLSSANGGTQ